MAKRSSDFGKGYWSILSTGLIVTIVPADSDTAILLQNGDNRCGPHVVAVADFVLLKPIKLSNGTLLGLQNLGLAFSCRIWVWRSLAEFGSGVLLDG